MNPIDMIKPATTGGFSFFDLFMTAHPVVKFVMIGLLMASIWAWAIIIEKLFAFRRARREADKFEQQFWSGQSLEELYAGLSRGRTLSMAALFVAAMREWKRSVEGNIRAMGGIQLRVEKVMDVTISREMEQLDRRLLFLATVGSTAPFIGLFGTVWGIMTSFQAIAASKNTSLAVVAPGIAEALFATALGLLAAIPAVIFYNKFAAELLAAEPAPGSLRRRVLGHRLAPDRRSRLNAATPPSFKMSIQQLKEKSKLVRHAGANLSKEFGCAILPDLPRAPARRRARAARARSFLIEAFRFDHGT